MTFVGVAGILLGLLAVRWLAIEQSNRKIGFFLLIAVIHVATTAIYYQYTQSYDADTGLYYFDQPGFYYRRFSLGTVFIIYLVQWLRGVIGGTYLDYFFLFQAFGVWGIALLVRALEELTIVLERPWPPFLTVLMFMPGMYFWTSAIGKDAPLFFACTLAVWSSMAITKRWLWFGIAIVVMVLFRPHIALIAIGSLALAVVAGRGLPLALRGVLVGLSLVSGALLLNTVQASLRVDLSSVGSIAGYLETSTATAAAAADGSDQLVSAPFPLKLISLLYRPFFFDSGGFFGLVASVQNVFMLFVTFVLVRNHRIWRAMFRESLPIRFATIFLFALILLLSFMYYNVGLGLRQREMFTPALYLIFAALYLVAKDKRQVPDDGAAAGLPTSPESAR